MAERTPIRLHEDADWFREALRFTAAQTGFSTRLIEKDYFCSVLLEHLTAADPSLNQETFGASGLLGRANEREVVLVRDLRAALARLNPGVPEAAQEEAVGKLTRVDFSRSLLQHNREHYGFIRDGVPVEWRDEKGEPHHARAR